MKLTPSQKQTLIIVIVLLLTLFSVKWLFDHTSIKIFPHDFFVPKVAETPKVELPEVFNPTTRVWADTLARHENCSPTGTWDTGSLSYGKYCFKRNTFLHYASSTGYYKNAETAELMNFIGDPYEQDKVLAWIIANDSKSLRGHWKTTIVYKKIGTPPK